ncbi:phage tail protein [Hymenobacter aquaticus]|uniref:Phage tail protein n=1 Tax=Hymenobacter aquaticus TaxID=1867101 RepID=A0A4Z0PWL2_9BACT|nr:tail fiber protein [Hymenobacter aquaticus]TGE21676.1 phage tail protein [Hymenobacter aquaticus]
MDEYIGIVKLFGGNFAPRDWAFCNGQLLPINQYQALFAVIGTFYGGNGTTNFALPNLNGRVAVGMGQSQSQTNYTIGQVGGVETVTLTTQQMPAHTHQLVGNTATGNVASPAGAMLGAATGSISTGDEVTVNPYTTTTPGTPTPMSPSAIAPVGGSQAHENRPPFLALNYIICLNGVFPSRS